jgi:hypothetical protein
MSTKKPSILDPFTRDCNGTNCSQKVMLVHDLKGTRQILSRTAPVFMLFKDPLDPSKIKCVNTRLLIGGETGDPYDALGTGILMHGRINDRPDQLFDEAGKLRPCPDNRRAEDGPILYAQQHLLGFYVSHFSTCSDRDDALRKINAYP